MGGGLFIYLFSNYDWWSISQCRLFFCWHVSRICKTLLSSNAVRHRESLGSVYFFPLMSLWLNPSCRLLIYCSDMLIVSYANKEKIWLLIISLHSSNRTMSSYAVIWNCLLVFLWPSCVFNLFIFYWPSFSLSASLLTSSQCEYEAVQRDTAANPCLIVFHMIYFWLHRAGCRPVNMTLWCWVKEDIRKRSFPHIYLTVAFEAEPDKHHRCLF